MVNLEELFSKEEHYLRMMVEAEKAELDFRECLRRAKERIQNGEPSGNQFLDFLITDEWITIQISYNSLIRIDQALKNYTGHVLITSRGVTSDMIESGGLTGKDKYEKRNYVTFYLGEHTGEGLSICAPTAEGLLSLSEPKLCVPLKEGAYFYSTSGCDMFNGPTSEIKSSEIKVELTEQYVRAGINPKRASFFGENARGLFVGEKAILGVIRGDLPVSGKYTTIAQLMRCLKENIAR